MGGTPCKVTKESTLTLLVTVKKTATTKLLQVFNTWRPKTFFFCALELIPIQVNSRLGVRTTWPPSEKGRMKQEKYIAEHILLY